MSAVEDVVVWRCRVVTPTEDTEMDGQGSVEHVAAHPVGHEKADGRGHCGHDGHDGPEDADGRETERDGHGGRDVPKAVSAGKAGVAARPDGSTAMARREAGR